MAVHDDLQRFVREALGQRLSREDIGRALTEAGWDAGEIAATLRGYAEVPFPVPVPRPRPALDAREAFLNLVLFSALFTSAFNVGGLIFQFIDHWLVDPAATRLSIAGAETAREMARWSVAWLVVAFPVFLLASRLRTRAAIRDSAKRPSPVRRWLTYGTLFVASGVVVGDLVWLVFEALAGALTTAFVLKAFTIAAIAGVVFGYCRADLRVDEGGAAGIGPRPRRVAALVATVATVVIAAGGIVVAGPPSIERLRRMDAIRARQLASLSSGVDVYYTRHHELPRSLTVLAAEVAADSLRDPESGMAYDYEVKTERTYAVCATFGQSTADEPARTDQQFWSHRAGRQCFDVEVREVGRGPTSR